MTGNVNGSPMRLNVRSPALKGLNKGEGLRKAVEQKMLHNETFDEAWTRLFAMKNSPTEESRLRAVKQAMEEGRIGRDPDSVGKRFSKAEAIRLHGRILELEREDTLRALVDNTPDNYKLVKTLADLDFLKQDIKASDLIAFDLETYSDVKGGALDPWTGKAAGFSVTANGNNYYVPLNHTEMPSEINSDKSVINHVKPALESAKTVMHNAPFDCKWAWVHYGLDLITNLHADTRIMAMALDENRSHRLKDLLTDWL